MPTGNPLEQLRRRMQSHATPAAFAALAEEHRRGGRLAEAIAVCRDGLERYPTYVSARVTLGRALLDSGDAKTAVNELEQAVAQAPDNLAAVRALDAARAVCADLPDLEPAPLLDDLTLHRAAVADAGPAFAADAASDDAVPVGLPPIPDLPFASLAGGADGPQEFGLRDDWTLPEPSSTATSTLGSWDDPPAAADDQADGSQTQAFDAHADAATMYFTPPSLQGDEPAGVWPVPMAVAGDAASQVTEIAPVYSWAIEEPGAPADDASQSADPAPDLHAASIWDEPTIEVVRPVVEAAETPAAEDSSSSAWTGLFEEPVGEGAAPASFAGWDAPGPTAPGKPSWGSEDIEVTDGGGDVEVTDSGLWSAPVGLASGEPDLAPGGSTFTWGEPIATASADAAPLEAFADDRQSVVASAESGDVAASEPPLGIAADWTAPEPVAADDLIAPVEEAAPFGALASADQASEVRVSEATWAGSVASALDEVFRLAGQPHAAAVEPPAPADDPHRRAMAEAAVEAALDDASGRGESRTPALASLQQMLEAVRARRASLFTDVTH